MMRVGWWLVRVLARALEPAERDVVLGDLAESGEGVGAATRNLLGLIVRRQVGLWLFWRPWLALFGVSCLAGIPLSRIAFRLNLDVNKYAAHYATSLTDGQEVAFLLFFAGAVLVWSWTSGFVLGSLSGRAVWITSVVFYFVVLDSAWIWSVVSGNLILRDPRTHQPPLDSEYGTLRLLRAAALPLNIGALLCVLPALFGGFVGARRDVVTLHTAYLVAAVNTILALLMTWTTGWYDPAHLPAGWPGVSWTTRLIPFLLVSCPATYLLALAYRRHSENWKSV